MLTFSRSGLAVSLFTTVVLLAELFASDVMSLATMGLMFHRLRVIVYVFVRLFR